MVHHACTQGCNVATLIFNDANFYPSYHGTSNEVCHHGERGNEQGRPPGTYQHCRPIQQNIHECVVGRTLNPEPNSVELNHVNIKNENETATVSLTVLPKQMPAQGSTPSAQRGEKLTSTTLESRLQLYQPSKPLLYTEYKLVVLGQPISIMRQIILCTPQQSRLNASLLQSLPHSNAHDRVLCAYP